MRESNASAAVGLVWTAIYAATGNDTFLICACIHLAAGFVARAIEARQQ